MNRILTIWVSGPYRSGTGGDPVLMEKNLRKLEDAALILFHEGHIPFIGEWMARPLLCHKLYNEILYPVAARVILKCDAVLRLPGESIGADADVRIAMQNNIPVYFSLDEILLL